MVPLGAPELLSMLLIVVVLFGAKRLAGIGGALGGNIRDFRRAVQDDPATAAEHEQTPRAD